MPNITISLDENLIRSGRAHAQKQGMSLDDLIQHLLAETTRQVTANSNWVDDCFDLMDKAMDQAHAYSKGRRWRREDLYDV